MEQLKLPGLMISKGDLLRIIRELDALNDYFIGVKNRKTAEPMQLPKSSSLLEELASINKLNLLEEQHRQKLLQDLKDVSNKAPTLHFSFATEASPNVLEPIVVWLRENIHPQALISNGYQPRLAAGCVLRTPNKIFDMSLGVHLRKQAPLLMHFLKASVDGS